mgnify:CR=1 FL=1
MKLKSVILGWSAPSIADQFPDLSWMDAAAYQQDLDDLLRLKMRGIVPPSEHKKAVGRLVKRLSTALAQLKEPKP